MSATLSPDEQQAWDRLRLEVEDPTLAAIVAMAEAPLVFPDPLRPVTVPVTVVNDIRRHAFSAAPNMEIVGALVLRTEDNVALRYEPLENLAKEPGQARVAWAPRARYGEEAILTHSHPAPALATPSQSDLTYRHHYKRLAIFHNFSGTLGIFAITPDRRSWAEVTTTLVA